MSYIKNFKDKDLSKKEAVEPSLVPFYSEENMARLLESAKEMEEKGGTIHEVLINTEK